MPEPTPSPAMQAFLDSLQIDYYKWHDGIGYDLHALRQLRGAEQQQAEDLLVANRHRDWREVEALAALATPRAIQALHDCLESPNNDVCLFAARYLKEMGIADCVEAVVVATLPRTRIGYGMTYALALARDYPGERIRETVLRCALHGNDDIRIHCAAMALHLYGVTEQEFDPAFPVIYAVGTQAEPQRRAAFAELCRLVGQDPARFG
ncbi:MAG: hypothetical protein HPY85_17165 [Anaerolineae bacterium]|nr:hypothetical protein [Anaerolineae bacterium]